MNFNWLYNMFKPEVKKSNSWKWLTDDERFYICTLKDEGKSAKYIAEHTGRAVSTVYKTLKER